MATCRSLRHVVRYTGLALLVYVGLVYLAYHLFKIVPTGFIPTQDQGYLIVNVQMPDASSIDRAPTRWYRKWPRPRCKTKGVDGTFAVSGFSILIALQLLRRRVPVPAPVAVQRTRRQARYGRRRTRGAAQSQVCPHPGRLRAGIDAPAGQRNGQCRRLHHAGRGSLRHRHAAAAGGGDRTPDRRVAQATRDWPGCSPPSAPMFRSFTSTSIASRPSSENVRGHRHLPGAASLSGRASTSTTSTISAAPGM